MSNDPKPSYAIAAAHKESKKGVPLARQVWEHEALARAAGLQLVLELHARRHPVSKAIGKLWKRRDPRVADTLQGIYLLRVDLAAVGPAAAVALTPYAIFGAPLFLAWSTQAQRLAANAFPSAKDDDVLEVLSAFFQDVAQGKPHTLHPAPRLPGLEARRQKTQDKSGKSAPAGTRSEPGSEVDVPRPVLVPKEGGLGDVETAAESGRAPVTSRDVAALEANLPAFLEQALIIAQTFLEEQGLRSDLSLHSLRSLDAFLDEQSATLDPGFIGRYLAPLGVYFGCVICAHGSANWYVDVRENSPIEALTLLVSGPFGNQTFQPVKAALERFGDAERGFYGQAVAMCRTL